MDGSAPGWYFSTVPRATAERAPETVDFHRTKYGRELLVDAGDVSRYAQFTHGGRPHRLAFHDVLLVTRGRGSFFLDGRRHFVAPGVVLFTGPGEVRQW